MYTVITAPTIGDLETLVNCKLAEGFILAGGVITVTHHSGYTSHQSQPKFRHYPNGYDNPVSFAQAVYKPATPTLT